MLDILAIAMSKAVTLLGVVVAFRPRLDNTQRKPLPRPVRVPDENTRRLWSKAVAPKSAAPFRQPQKPLSPSEHFARVSMVVTTALTSARIVAQMHEAARTQLEVVEFSIDRILDEVASVMTLTPQMAAIVKPVPVVVPLRRAA